MRSDKSTLLLYNFLINQDSQPSTYKIDNSFYIATYQDTGLCLLIFKVPFSNKGILSNEVTSSKICHFVNNGYRYGIDTSGIWIDLTYRIPKPGEMLSCVEWVSTTVAVNTSKCPQVSSTYCFNKNDETVLMVMKDSTNNIGCKYTCVIAGDNDNLEFKNNMTISDNIHCVIHS